VRAGTIGRADAKVPAMNLKTSPLIYMLRSDKIAKRQTNAVLDVVEIVVEKGEIEDEAPHG
jgi:hypothetical protein